MCERSRSFRGSGTTRRAMRSESSAKKPRSDGIPVSPKSIAASVSPRSVASAAWKRGARSGAAWIAARSGTASGLPAAFARGILMRRTKASERSPPPSAETNAWRRSRACRSASASNGLLLPKLHQHLFRDGFQGVEDAEARRGGRLERRLALEVQLAVELLGGHRRREVALVELEDVGDVLEVEPVLVEVLVKVLER